MSSAKLRGSFYRPGQGGHAPGDLRDAFIEAVDAYEAWQEGAEPTVELRDQQTAISQICGLLWNCSDTLPGHVAQQIRDMDPHEEMKGGTYAAGARWMKSQMPIP